MSENIGELTFKIYDTEMTLACIRNDGVLSVFTYMDEEFSVIDTYHLKKLMLKLINISGIDVIEEIL